LLLHLLLKGGDALLQVVCGLLILLLQLLELLLEVVGLLSGEARAYHGDHYRDPRTCVNLLRTAQIKACDHRAVTPIA
jgi:uncharacterized Tic20 family protein